MSVSLFEESEGIELQTASTIPLIAPGEVLLGVLSSISDIGSPVVKFPQFPHLKAVSALSTIPILSQYIGRQVALLFTQEIIPQPIVLGFLYSPLQQMLDNPTELKAAPEKSAQADHVVFDECISTPLPIINTDLQVDTVHLDGKRVVLEGQEEVVLRCGEASITLTRNGKIVIRGKYLLSRASGVNRILGGSVQVN